MDLNSEVAHNFEERKIIMTPKYDVYDTPDIITPQPRNTEQLCALEEG